MRVEKSFTVTLNVADPIEFGTDCRKNARLSVQQNYVGKCYMGYFIISIKKISRLSEIYINKTGTVGAGTIDVDFVAVCSRFNKGDLYAGVRVSRTNQVMSGSGAPPVGDEEPIVVSIENPSEVLADGFIIPVVIDDIVYPPAQSSPAASVHMLTCRRSPVIWIVSGGSVPTALISEMGRRIQAAIAHRAAAEGNKDGASLVTLFRILLHSYSGGKAPAGPSVCELNSQAALAEWAAELRPGTAWSRPLTEQFDSTGVASVNADESSTTADAASVFTAIAAEIESAVRFMGDAARTYVGQSLMKNQIGVWRVMKNAQIAQ